MNQLKLTKKYEKYPEYKNSGMEWLGKIPKEWNIVKFKGIFDASNERVVDDSSVTQILSVSGYRGIEKKDISSNDGQMPSDDVGQYRIVRPGQLVVNTMWLNYTGLGVSKYTGFVSPAYRAYNVADSMNADYAHYLLRSIPYVQKYSSLLYGIRPNSLQVKPMDFERIEVLSPSTEEQTKIAKYLDKKTAIIDQIIEKKQKLIELLREKRTAVINKELADKTKGKWKNEKIKHLVKSIESGVWGENPVGNSDDIKCLRVADFDYENLSFYDVETVRNNAFLSKKKVLQYGDILIEKSGGGEKTPVGRAILFNSNEKMVCANFIDVIRVNKGKVLPDFLVLYLSILYSGRINTKYIKQNTGIQNIDVKSYFGEMISFPEIRIQKDVIDSVHEKMSNFDEAITKVEKTIQTLQEFKSSLISNVVTGKVKV